MNPTIASRPTVLLLSATLAGFAHGQLAPGLSLNFDASNPASGVDGANWNSLTTDATQDFDFAGDVTLETVTSPGSLILKAYRFTGGTGDANNATWNTLFGEGDATSWEFWLKPDDTGDATQVIYESGGSGTGFAIWYSKGTDSDSSGTVHFTIDGGSGLQVETVSAVIDTTDFRQITCVYDESAGGGSIDLMEIWVDGVLVDDNLSATTGDDASNDNDNTTINDYCGGDGTGLGNANNSLADGASDGEFDGDIAIFRVWGGKALTPTEIAGNYTAGTELVAAFTVDAGLDADGDDRWEDTTPGNPSGAEFLLDQDPGEAVTRAAITGSNTSLTHAYDFPGGSGEQSSERGALMVNTGTTTPVGAEDIGWDQLDVAIEIWFRPDNINPSAGNGQILWETGGGSGLGFFIDDNQLVLSHDNLAAGTISYNLSTDPDGRLLAGATTEFIQAVGAFRPSTDELELYINGVSVATATVTSNDWSGADDAALGTRGGANTGGFGNESPGFNSYDGEVALVRIYIANLPNDAEIEAAFDDLSGPDLLAPTLTNLTPADDEPAFFSGNPLTATFSEPIALINGGTVTLVEDPNGSPSNTVITVPDAGQLNVSGSTLTITPTGGLTAGADYAVQIGSATVEDLAGNDFGGIADTTTWNFTTLPPDSINPGIGTLNPADDASDISITLSTLEITFDETVQPGTGDMELVRVGDSTIVATLDVTNGTQVSFAGAVVTLTPGVLLDVNTEYAVRIDPGAVLDLSNNGFPGISDLTTWSFTTEIFPDPVAYWPMRDGADGVTVTGADDLIDAGLTFNDASVSGNNNATWAADPDRGIVYFTGEGNRLNAGTQGIDRNTGFTWSFWANVAASNATDPGADSIIGTRSSSGGSWHKLQINGSSNWANVDYNSGTSYDTWHHFAYVGDSTSVRMYVDGQFIAQTTSTNGDTFNGNMEIGGASNFSEDITGLMSDVAIWQTALPVELITQLANDEAVLVNDLTAPVLAATTPVDDDAAASALTLQAIFDELVTLGTGDIRIVNLTTPGTTTISVTDGSQVTVSGAAMTITPAVPLVGGQTYAIEMDSGVVVNKLAGLPFGGIPDQTTWNFTVETTPPSLASTIPVDEATAVHPAANLSATFDEPVAAGTGSIELKNLTDTTSVFISVGGSEVSFSGNTVTIDPAALLLPGRSYAVQIPAGVLTDVAGNPFAGILDDTTWNFATATPPTGLIVYEGFQYADPANPDILGGQPDDPGVTDTDALGLAGTWNDASGGNTGNTMFLKTGSLPFGDLARTGNHIGFNSNSDRDIYHRDPTPTAQLGISGNPEIWFSFLADKVANNFSAAEGGIVIGNQVVANSEIVLNNGSDGLIGFGAAPTGSGNNWTAYAWNGSSQVAGDASLPVGIGSGDVRLLVGKIAFDVAIGGADEFTLYEYQLSGTSTVAGGTLSQIASPLEVDIDQTVLDTLNVTRQVNTSYDEIRIGTSLADVVPGSVNPPSTAYDDWAATFAPDDVSNPNGNNDGDSLVNLLEFAFGTDPTVSSAAALTWNSGTMTFTVGTPTIAHSFPPGGGVDFVARFVRRANDAGDPGSVDYALRFSSDLNDWESSAAAPGWWDPLDLTVLATDGDYELVEYPYPFQLDNFKKARFFQVEVTEVTAP